jgi:hypothetical protein
MSTVTIPTAAREVAPAASNKMFDRGFLGAWIQPQHLSDSVLRSYSENFADPIGRRKTSVIFALLLFFASVIFGMSVQGQVRKRNPPAQARITVAPNILVSRDDANMPHAETMIAVNPKDEKNLIGTSIVFTNFEYGTTCKTYASKDGGYTWLPTSFPERFDYGSADPQVVFGPRGTAYFNMLSSGKSNAIHFYRSEDGGFNWQKSKDLAGADHPQMVVDQTDGNFSGRVYISIMRSIRKLAVSRSEDDGRTFAETVEVPNPRGFFLLNMNPLVFKDGTLFIPYLAWDDTGGKTPPSTVSEFVTSTDGGKTFSEPIKILEQPFKKYVAPTELRGSFVGGVGVVYAVDRRTDRLYLAASDDRFGKRRVLFSFSADKGKTWSAARQVSPDVLAESSQFQPMIAVNNEGTVGVAWFDTRDSKNQDSYNLYFAASIDGGQSFLPSRRISSEPSFPAAARNLTPFSAQSTGTAESANFRLRTAFGRWGDGGDYMGFTADAKGVFHPFWIDSRGGASQVYTTRITVDRGGKASFENPNTNNLTKEPLNKEVIMVIDPPEYNIEKQEAIISIRLKNVSADIIYGPITVEVKNLTDWTILNAENGKTAAGAIFDYSSALGDYKFLEPGALTEAVKWKFKYSGLGSSPSIESEITGYTFQKTIK